MRKGILLSLGIGLLLAIFAVIIAYTFRAFQPSSSSQPSSSLTDSFHATGKVGDTLVTPEGVQVTLVATEQRNGQLRFHLKIHSSQTQAVTNMDRGFALYNNTTKAFVITTTTIPAPDVATHPALPNTVVGPGDADGWVAFDAPVPSPYTSTLFYRYRVVHTQRCPNSSNGAPINQYRCQPADLYSTIRWDF